MFSLCFNASGQIGTNGAGGEECLHDILLRMPDFGEVGLEIEISKGRIERVECLAMPHCFEKIPISSCSCAEMACIMLIKFVHLCWFLGINLSVQSSKLWLQWVQESMQTALCRVLLTFVVQAYKS